MHGCRLLILTAIRPEYRAIAGALGFPKKSRKLWEDKGDRVLAVVGIRAVHLVSVLAEVRPEAVLMAGLAGALSPELSVGDLVYSDSIESLAISGARGNITTSEKVVSTAAEKQAIFRATGALAVDMETQVVAAFVERMGVPFLAVRAISDAAHEPLDPALLKLIDPEGNPRFTRAAAHVFLHPGKIPSLLHIKRATDLALSRLGAAIGKIVASNWPKQHEL